MHDIVLPRSVPKLFALVECLIQGLQTHAEALQPPEHISPGLLEESLAQARSACQNLKQVTQRAPALAQACRRASAETKSFFPAAKSVLNRHLGARWSQKWKNIGWVTRRGRCPVGPKQRELLLAAIWRYFQANPSHQAPSSGVTQEAIVRYYKPLREARLALETNEAELTKARRTRTRAMKRLRGMVRETIDYLDSVLDDLEESWEPFGLIPPALQVVPAWVWPLKLAPLPAENGSGKIQISWGQSPRALYYEVFRRTQGIDQDFIFVDCLTETQLILENLPVKTPIRIRVVPVNLAGAGFGAEEEMALEA
jgi:hypothetical protein